MGAITSSDTMFTLPLELRDTLKLDYDHPMSPYDKRSPVLLEYAQGLKALPVPEKLTLEEATSLMSIWKNENVLVGGKLFISLFLPSITASVRLPSFCFFTSLLRFEELTNLPLSQLR